jgi:hypothetical protein
MERVEIRITYEAPVMSGYETVTFGNMMTACDEVNKICTRGILPKVELIFDDGTIKEVSASCMC